MKLNKMAWLAAAVIGLTSGSAHAQQYGSNSGVQPASCTTDCTCDEPVCGCEAVCEPECGAEVTCDSGCDSLCGGGLGLGLGSLLECNHGEKFSLFGEYNGLTMGGWAQLGYHTAGAAIPGNQRFNNHPDRINLHQGWLFAEQAIDASCGFDIGGRVDYLYGVDAQNTQAFGIGNDHWDNGWDNGIYGHAIPQAYVEMGYGDLSVKMGHFFTIIGFEVVAAPDNFFYSHAHTMINSEPFTHTGALATYKLSDDVKVYGGYVLGWDSGFEDNGDSYLGGVSMDLTEDVNLTYATVFGRFNEEIGERGYMHSVVLNTALTSKLNYVFQTDYLDTHFANDAIFRNTIGVNQYLIYSINDCWGAGARLEWYNLDTTAFDGPGEDDLYDLTFGLNYRPGANVLIRPEVRWDWAKGNVASVVNEDFADSQTTFGVDAILLF